MDMLRRTSGAVLLLMAFAVALHTIVEPLYHASSKASPYSPVWSVLGWLMFVPLALGVTFGYLRKRDAGRAGPAGAVTRELLAAQTHFYGGLFFGIMFLWNWFN